VSIYIISVNLHAFFLLAVVSECSLLNFACYYILLRFNICWMILRSVMPSSQAIISVLLNTRSGQGQGQGQDDRVKSIFRSIDCKSPRWRCWYGDLYDVPNIWYRNNHATSCRSRPRSWRYIWRHGVVHGTLWVTSRRSQQHLNSKLTSTFFDYL